MGAEHLRGTWQLSSHEPYAQVVGNERNDGKRFMFAEQFKKEQAALHELAHEPARKDGDPEVTTKM